MVHVKVGEVLPSVAKETFDCFVPADGVLCR
jgi:hypothetical protein